MDKVDLTAVAQLPEFKERVRELALQYGFKLKEQASGNMDLHSYVYEFAEALIKEAKSQAIPEGFVLVPKEPTQKMLDATINLAIPAVYMDSISGQRKLEATSYYKAMINKAQEQDNE